MCLCVLWVLCMWYVYTCMCVCGMFMCICAWVYTCVYVYVYVWIYVFVCTMGMCVCGMFMCICAWVCMCMCMYMVSFPKRYPVISYYQHYMLCVIVLGFHCIGKWRATKISAWFHFEHHFMYTLRTMDSHYITAFQLLNHLIHLPFLAILQPFHDYNLLLLQIIMFESTTNNNDYSLWHIRQIYSLFRYHDVSTHTQSFQLCA